MEEYTSGDPFDLLFLLYSMTTKHLIAGLSLTLISSFALATGTITTTTSSPTSQIVTSDSSGKTEKSSCDMKAMNGTPCMKGKGCGMGCCKAGSCGM